ncbi:E3 ubiquitin-protein ligase rnf13 [Actinomortierella ambigua]|nr:E3 ubiquitin-protein ligase rnf13 [Actinomortierella ambigua]
MRFSVAQLVVLAVLAATSLPSLSVALPLARRQDPSALPSTPSNAPSSSPSLTPRDSQRPKFIQLPLVEVFSPNVTLFAAIDMPLPKSDDNGSNNGNDLIGNNISTLNGTIDGDTAPLILPSSSLGLSSSQILHVNESLMFGFGGKEPLQGVLIEWTLGCNISRIFPFVNPSDRPWIALVSTASLTPPRPSSATSPATGIEDDTDTLQPGKADIGSDSPNSSVSPKSAPDRNGTYCTVSRLSRLLQRASNNVAGMIIYEDPVQADWLARNDPRAKGIPFTQVRIQSEQALNDMVSYWSQAIHRHWNGQKPDDPPNPPTGEDREVGDEVGTGDVGPVAFPDSPNPASPPPSPTDAPEAAPTRQVYIRKRQFSDSGSASPRMALGGVSESRRDSALPLDNDNIRSVRAFGVMAIADQGLINMLRQRPKSEGKEDDDSESQPMSTGNSTMTSLLNSRNLVVAQLTFSNPIEVPIGPMVPPHPPSEHDPTLDAERPEADKSLGLFFWIILGAVVLVIGVWVGFGVAEARSMNRRRREARANRAKLKTLTQEELEKFKTHVFRESDIIYSDDEDESDSDEKRGSGGAMATSNGTALTSSEHNDDKEQPDQVLDEKQGWHSSLLESVAKSLNVATHATEPSSETNAMSNSWRESGPHAEQPQQPQQQQRKQPVYSRFWAKPAGSDTRTADHAQNLSGVAGMERSVAPAVGLMSDVPMGQDADDYDIVRRRSSSLDGSHYSSRGGTQQYRPHHQPHPHPLQHHYRETSQDMSERSSCGLGVESSYQEPPTSAHEGPYPRGHPFSISGFFFDRSAKCQSWDERKRELVQYDTASCISSSSSSASLSSNQRSSQHAIHPLKTSYDYRSHAQEGWINLGPETLRVFNGVEAVAIAIHHDSENGHQHGNGDHSDHHLTGANRDVSDLDLYSSSLPVDATTHGTSSAPPPFPTIPCLLYTQPTLRRKHRFILPRKIDTLAAMEDGQKQGDPELDDDSDDPATAVPLHSARSRLSAGFKSPSSTLYPLGDQWTSGSGIGRRRSSLGSVAAAAIMESYLNTRRRSSQATAVAANDSNFGGYNGGPSLPPSALRSSFFEDAMSSSSTSSRSSLKDHGEPLYPQSHQHSDHPPHHLQHRHSTPARRSFELWTPGTQDGNQTLRRGSVQVHRVLPPSMPSPVVSSHMPSVAHVLYHHHPQQLQEPINPLQEKKDAQGQALGLPSQLSSFPGKKENDLGEPCVGSHGLSAQVHDVAMPTPPPLDMAHTRESSDSAVVHLADLRKQDSQETAVGEGNIFKRTSTLSSPLMSVKRVSLDKAAMQARQEIEQLQAKTMAENHHEKEESQHQVTAADVSVRPSQMLRRSSGQQVYRIAALDDHSSKASLDKDSSSSSLPSTPRAVLTSADKGKAPLGRINDSGTQRQELLLHTSSAIEEEVRSARQRLSQMGIELPGVYAPTSGEFSRLSIDSELFRLDDTSMPDPHAGAGVGSATTTAAGADKHLEASNQEQNGNHSNESKDDPKTKSKKRKYDPCAICLHEYIVGDIIRELPCRHAFHALCIDPYFLKDKAVCPLCKRDYSEAGRRRAAALAAGANDSSGSDSTSEERGRRNALAYFTPLALLAGANGGAHYWYASETLIHVSPY